MVMLTGKICQVCDANDEYTLGRNKEESDFYIYGDAYVGITYGTTSRIIYMKLKYVGKIAPRGNSINPLGGELNRMKE